MLAPTCNWSDPVHQMRQAFERDVKRRSFSCRIQPASIPETTRTEEQLLGDEAEAKVQQLLAWRGYAARETGHNERYDLVIETEAGPKKIEVKASRFRAHRNGGGRYQANLRGQANHADLFIFCLKPDDEADDWRFFVIPAEELAGNASMCITSRYPEPGKCRSKWMRFLGAWGWVDRIAGGRNA